MFVTQCYQNLLHCKTSHDNIVLIGSSPIIINLKVKVTLVDCGDTNSCIFQQIFLQRIFLEQAEVELGQAQDQFIWSWR